MAGCMWIAQLPIDFQRKCLLELRKPERTPYINSHTIKGQWPTNKSMAWAGYHNSTSKDVSAQDDLLARQVFQVAINGIIEPKINGICPQLVNTLCRLSGQGIQGAGLLAMLMSSQALAYYIHYTRSRRAAHIARRTLHIPLQCCHKM